MYAIIAMMFLLTFSLFRFETKGEMLQNAVKTAKNYHNPVVNISLPDPTLIKSKNGFFYLHATENIRNVLILRSTNLMKWEADRYCFYR